MKVARKTSPKKPATFDDFIEAEFDEGLAKVPNPDPMARTTTPLVRVDQALEHSDPRMRRKFENRLRGEFRKWKKNPDGWEAPKDLEPRSTPSGGKKKRPENRRNPPKKKRPENRAPAVSFERFRNQVYEGGKALVRNPNPHGRQEEVAFDTAMHTPAFRDHVMTEYEAWKDKQRGSKKKRPENRAKKAARRVAVQQLLKSAHRLLAR